MSFITVQGEQLIAAKIGANQTLQITHFVLANIAGLGAEPANRIEVLPAAGDIVDTRPVTRQGYVNTNQVVYSLALDSTIGNYTFNWVGLKAAGGELVACEHISPITKTANNGATPGNNLTRNFLLAFSGAQGVTAIAVPAETWQIDFTTRLLQIDERERLSNFDVYGQSAFFADGFKVEFISGTTYRVKAGLGYVGGIRCKLNADTNITLTAPPKGIWLDASLQGNINGVSEVVNFNITAVPPADYTDGLGFKHFVGQIASVSSQGVVTDTRVVAPRYLLRDDIVPQAEAEAGTAMTPRAWTALRVKQAVLMIIAQATEAIVGRTRYATAQETQDGTLNNAAVHPAGLSAALNAYVEKGTGIGQLANIVKMGWSAANRLKVTIDNTDLGNVVFDFNLVAYALKTYVDAADALKANLASPIFTGAPKAPTPAATDNSTNIITSAWAKVGLAISLGDTAGYIKFPTWMGGFILQYQFFTGLGANTSGSITFPIAFPTRTLCFSFFDRNVGAGGLDWATGYINFDRFGITYSKHAAREEFGYWALGK